jgi:hypothetical protein
MKYTVTLQYREDFQAHVVSLGLPRTAEVDAPS